MTTVLLDTHVVVWLAIDPDRLSQRAASAIADADELAVASATWFELAWLVSHGKITVSKPLRAWLAELAGDLRSVATTPEIAVTAVGLSDSFPGDPSDRLIYATAIELGWTLVTRDERLLGHPHPNPIAIW